MKFLKVLVLGLLFTGGAMAQNKATIYGTVTDKENGGDPMPFANVVVKGTTTGITTDIDGNYELTLKPGSYTIEYSFIGYETFAKTFDLKEGDEIKFDYNLAVNTAKLEEITLVEKVNRESKSVMMLERKKATAMVQSIGSLELSEKGASDVSDGVTKMSGITKVSSKYIFVRGMGDRYNIATLNGMTIPSPTPDTKLIPLDIFPMDIVSSIGVDKSFDVSKPGDYAGGNINIVTKASTTDSKLSIGLGSGYNSITTFKDFNSSNRGKYDFFGYDDGSRALNSTVASTDYYYGTDLGDKFNNNLSGRSSKAPLNYSGDISYNEFFKFNSESSLGILISGSFSNDYRNYSGILRNINANNVTRIDYKTNTNTYSTSKTGLASIFYQINNRNNIEFTSLYSQLSSDVFKENTGTHFDYSEKIITARRQTYRENSLWWNQLKGEHQLNQKIEVDWAASYSIANSTEPDRTQLVFLQDANIQDAPYSVNYIDVNENHRFFSWLDETEIAGQVSGKYIFDQNEMEKLSYVELGAQTRLKQRNFDYRQFNYIFSTDYDKYVRETLKFNGFPIDNADAAINSQAFATGLVRMKERGDNSSKQVFNFNVNSAYLRYFQNFGKIDMSIGVRAEIGTQRVEYNNPQIANMVDVYSIEDPYFLPSLILKYKMSDDNSLKFSASQTISRPGFREMSNFEYVEDFAGMKSRGNPNLKNGINYNVDLRWEKFTNLSSMFAVSVFGKYLDQPIEKAMIATASGQLQTFVNADMAYVAGVEAEWVSKLSQYEFGNILDNIELGFNASYIYSRAENTSGSIPSTSIGGGNTSVVQTNSVRPLEGASPFIANLDLKYNINPLKTSVSLAYNVFGERLIRVGSNNIGDTYQQPVNTLNMTIQSRLTDRLKLKFSAKNLLDPSIQEIQYQGDVENIVNEYKLGVNLSLSLNYDLM